MNRKVACCVVAVVSALSAFAVERTWIGPETGGLWRDAKNWDPEGRIGVDDIPVFNREGTFEIGVAPSDSPYNYLAGLKCEKGTVRIFNTGDSKNYKNYFRLKSAGEGAVRTNDFYVAGDAYLIVSNAVIANSSGRAAIRKTGAGTRAATPRSSHPSASRSTASAGRSCSSRTSSRRRSGISRRNRDGLFVFGAGAPFPLLAFFLSPPEAQPFRSSAGVCGVQSRRLPSGSPRRSWRR